MLKYIELEGYSKECPYCGEEMENNFLSVNAYGQVKPVQGDYYRCTSKDCSVKAVFREDEDGFLVECGVEDVKERTSNDEIYEYEDDVYYDDDAEEYDEDYE